MRKIDKRSKEWRNMSAEEKETYNQQSKGLGDTIEKITEATGIKKAVKFLFGEDCGCDERKAKLNKYFSYIECLTEDEYIWLTEFFKTNTNSVKYNERRKLIEIYNRVFGKRLKDTTCASCIKNIVDNLKSVYNEY